MHAFVTHAGACVQECAHHRSKHILAFPQWVEVRQGTDIRVRSPSPRIIIIAVPREKVGEIV